MLARMEIDVETLRRMAALGGFAWTGAELESLRPAVERLLEMLEHLEAVPIGELEPTTQYRVL
jgi:Asp-tRNA(Asn)/Glu-tRNA(Gln) amidotransferase C subunit